MKLSDLQERILAELESRPAETQEDLAHRIGTHQPSISRSIRSLMDSGLVVKRDEKYELAPAGQALIHARQNLDQVLSSATVRHYAEFSQKLNRQMAELQKSLVSFNQLQRHIYESVSFANDLASDFRGLEQIRSRIAQTVAQPLELIESVSRLRLNTIADWKPVYEQAMQASSAIADLVQSSSVVTTQFQQKLSNITRGMDETRRSLVAGLAVADQVSRTFDQLEIFENIREAIAEEQAAAEAFRAAGWPIAPSMPRAVIRRVTELHQEGKTGYASQTILGYYRRDNHRNLVQMVDGWRDHPLVESRIHVIDDALEAHCEGKYTLSVPALMPQIEGVMSEYVVASNLPAKLGRIHDVYTTVIGDPMDQAFSTWAVAETLLYQLQANVYTYSDFRSELMRPVNRRDTTRHTVTHGITPSYNRESDSLRAFLLLDALSALTLS